MKKITFIVLFSFLLLYDFSVLGAGLVPCGGPGEDPCTFCDLFKLMQNVINFIIIDIVPPVAILIFVVAGIMFLVSAGDPGLLARSRNIFKTAVLGLAIIYGAWLIVGTILLVIGVAEWTGLGPHQWFQIKCP